MIYVLFFIMGVVADVLSVLWTFFNTSGHRHAIHGAAGVSALIGAVAMFSGNRIAWDIWLMLPELLGMVVGVYLGFFLRRKLQRV